MAVSSNPVPALALLVLLPLTLHAQNTQNTQDAPTPEPAAASAVTLDPITVTATKSVRRSSEVPATLSVIEAERLEREIVEDLRDLVRYEPGVTVPYQGSRFGNAGISIRGLGGNRVQTEVDGVGIADSFAIGSFSNAGRDFVDLDTLKRVEIVRGPASSIYGSDALGGVLAFTTRDPRDVLDAGETFGGRARLGWLGADATTAGSVLGAAAGESWSGLLSVVRREGEELDNAGDVGGTGAARTQPNPHESRGTNILAKLLLNESGADPLRLTLERFDLDSETEALTAIGSSTSRGTTTSITEQTADDEALRERASLDQRIDGVPVLGDLNWRLYTQRSRTTQDSFESRTLSSEMSGTSERERERRAIFQQRVNGAELTASREFGSGTVTHRWVAGLELERTETEQSRNGQERNLTAGTQTRTVGPDTFPVRDFPKSDTLEAGLYVQDDIRMGRVTVIPGLRVDRYDLDPKPDATFTDDNPGIEPAGLKETQVSPKLGLVFALSDSTNAWAQYAEGFRAPPYSDVNVGFTNLQFGYTAIPNPDLKPETSQGIELGLRGQGVDGAWALTAFQNRYEDFIESFVSLGPNADGVLVFQSQNLSEVEIEGIEARAELNLRRVAAVLSDLRVRSALAYARGDDKTADAPLNSIEPLTAVLGLAWAPSTLPLELELIATGHERKRRVEDPEANPNAPPGTPPPSALFRSPGSVRLDLLAAWQPTSNVSVNAGVFNLTDRKLYAWSSVQGRSDSDPAIDRFTDPGINASVNLRVQF